jgi:hypothetical protein
MQRVAMPYIIRAKEINSMQSASPSVGTADGLVRRLRRLTGLQVVLLSTQFLIGMLVNFYVTVPGQHPGANGEYFSGVFKGVVWALGHAVIALRLHVAIGLALAVVGLTLIWQAVRSRQRVWILTALVGGFGIFVAGFNGASFMNYGHDFSSLLMSIGFLIAALGYGYGAYLAR